MAGFLLQRPGRSWNELGTGTYDVVVFSSPVLGDDFFNAITTLKNNSSGLKYLLLSCRPLSAREREMFDSQIAKPIGLEALHAAVTQLLHENRYPNDL